MNRIEAVFAELRGAGRKGLMPFVCGGYPTLASTADVLPALERAGACIVEVGIPFSDPIADGPVIAAAMHEALLAGATPSGVMRAVAGVRSKTSLGLVAMVSVSIVQRLGAARMVREAKAAGFDGFIFPDVPVEESAELAGLVREAGMTISLLVAPTTPGARAERIVRACTGFVYLLARAGITGEAAPGRGRGPGTKDEGGAQRAGAGTLRERVAALRGMTDLPIACGFGIATPEQVAGVVRSDAAGADAAIVGSALVKRMARATVERGDPVDAAESFVRSLRVGLG